jgi:hypothetical protein
MDANPYLELQDGESRLLQLLPGHFGSTLQNILEIFSLKAAPEYEALSYTWGKAFEAKTYYDALEEGLLPRKVSQSVDKDAEASIAHTTDILISPSAATTRTGPSPQQAKAEAIDGKYIDTCSFKWPVGDNLHAALQYLRHADRVRTLWIDALCPNQSNIPERSQQVLQMGHIYTLASEVLVWLGEAAHNNDDAFRCIRELHEVRPSNYLTDNPPVIYNVIRTPNGPFIASFIAS